MIDKNSFSLLCWNTCSMRKYMDQTYTIKKILKNTAGTKINFLVYLFKPKEVKHNKITWNAYKHIAASNMYVDAQYYSRCKYFVLKIWKPKHKRVFIIISILFRYVSVNMARWRRRFYAGTSNIYCRVEMFRTCFKHLN